MKDYTWLAAFSVFTLVVGFLFTYGTGTKADSDPAPVQVFVTSTSTPSAPIIIENDAPDSAPPIITVNVYIATSSLAAASQAPVPTSEKRSSSSNIYYVTHNYVAEETIEEETAAITLSIDGLYDAVSTPIDENETLLELLTRLSADDSNLALTTQDYGDMGVLVTGMGGLVNGTDDKYWQYLVNGEAPMVGADQYELEDGDVVVWEFKGF